MNPNYRHDITVYNRISADDIGGNRDIWHRHVLHGCSFIYTTSEAVAGTLETGNSSFVVRIPKSSIYLPYKAYITSPDGHFTLSVGDVVMLGAGPDIFDRSILHNNDAFEIAVFSDNSRGIDGHYKVTS